MFRPQKYNIKKIFRTDLHLIALGLLLVFIIRILRPVITIRVAQWNLASRIGHLACESDIYLAEKKWKIDQDLFNKTIYLYYIPGRKLGSPPLLPNQYLFSHVKKIIPSLKYSRIISWTDFFNTKFFQDPAIKAFGPDGHVDEYVVTSRTPPLFFMNKKDIKHAQKNLRLLGIDEKKSILLFFNRDSSYIKTYLKCDNDYINDFRNSLIVNYLPMTKHFVQIGYDCIRMGIKTEEKILEQPGIVDFSSHSLDEIVEFYLFSIAKFSVCDMTGLNILPALFRKPRVMVNVISLLTFYNNGFFQAMFDSILTFKKHWCLLQDRLLTVSEIAEKGLLNALKTDDYIKNNVKLINNTPEEIQEAALEMHLRLNNEWEETEEDLILQHRFWKKLEVKRDSRFTSLYPKVGANFLRNNDWLLK